MARWGIAYLVGRRSRQGSWAYAVWLMLYLLTAWLFAGELAFHSGAGPYQMLPLLIPVFVVAAQIAYPTLLGWSLIFVPSILYCGAGIYFLLRNSIQMQPQWDYDPGGFIMGSFFVIAYLTVCLCLLFARPKPAAKPASQV